MTTHPLHRFSAARPTSTYVPHEMDYGQNDLGLTPDDTTNSGNMFELPPNPLTAELEAMMRALQQSAAAGIATTTSPTPAAEAWDADDDFDAEARLPSGWYKDESSASKRKPIPVLHGLAGLTFGLLVAAPLASWFAAPHTPAPLSRTEMIQMALDIVAEATANASRHAAGPGLDQARIEVMTARSLTTPVYEPTIAEARRLIGQGDVVAARDTLSTAAAAKSPKALFAMAETFDPNRLAAWGSRGVNADPLKAKELYEAALGLGLEAAEARLDALK
jgi:hypothetical protein